MSNRRETKLKKNPFVRFLRIVYRKAQEERLALEALNAKKELEARQRELERQEREQFMTVGELLERVKWQLPKEKAVEVSAPPEYDVSLN
jgi:hypothetical protein